ncbi:Slc24a2 [Symbiodinium natans]|uniref:Slc24a2 protein n=1 Tax=Symbiodinium natans TaxID=878477 RepID=A0A812UT15_9DINO|nr:Slc24a2 [Symbiodinium natans]
MGLVRFNKKALRSLEPFQRRKITTICSISVALAFLLISLAQDLSEDSSSRGRRLYEDDPSTTASPKLYPADLLLNEPYEDEPTGRKFLALFHCVGIAYMVLGLNTVCDVYFAGSIDLLCDAWSLTPDVAGATWMAAGGSAPEFFTSIVGATIAQNDVGFGTIVGSAVFNVLFVIGLCGYVAKGNIELTWWPLFRDCTYYIISLGVLAAFTYNQTIAAWEAAILFTLYIGYVSFMFINRPLNIWAYQKTGTPLNKELREYVEQMSKSKTKVEPEEVVVPSTGDPPAKPEVEADQPEPAKDNYMKEDRVVEKAKPDEEEKQDLEKPGTAADGEDEEDDDDDDEPEDFMMVPEGTCNRILWGLGLPVYVLLYFTLPWPSKGSKLFMLTFGLSLIWIGAFAFLLVWWTDTVTTVLGIPTIVSSVTFLAAATSIPDAVSSMAVARKGQADMAVSSSVGSNIFDILVGLPIPWLIKCALEANNPEFKGVSIQSPYLMFYTCVLLGMVFGTVLSIKICGWKLTKALGGCMAVLYFAFIITTVVVELTRPVWLMTNPPT